MDYEDNYDEFYENYDEQQEDWAIGLEGIFHGDPPEGYSSWADYYYDRGDTPPEGYDDWDDYYADRDE